MIPRLEAIEPLVRSLQPQKTGTAQEAAGSFGDIFKTAVENVRETDREKTQAEYLLATGQLDNPATLTIASTKNGIAVKLLVELRNKAMDAYSEIMRSSM